jgi:hypothetical protein
MPVPPSSPLTDVPPGGLDNAEHRRIAQRGLILLGMVGSTAHGLHLKDADDRDEMGVCVEPREYVLGLPGWQQDPRRFQQWNYRTKAEGQRSGPGDLDLCVYALRKYAWLAARGNPTILILLFVEPLYATPLGTSLRDGAEMFASKSAGHRYIRYLEAQHDRLLGIGPFTSTRTELIERYGFDTKLAMHVLRLGFQGVEYLRTGRLTLPMVGEPREYCFAARKGEIPLEQVVARASALKAELTGLVAAASPLPDSPDEGRINAFLVRAHEEAWQL